MIRKTTKTHSPPCATTPQDSLPPLPKPAIKTLQNPKSQTRIDAARQPKILISKKINPWGETNKPISYKSTTTNNQISSQLTKKKPLPKNSTPSSIVVVTVYKSHRHPADPICGFRQLHSLAKPSKNNPHSRSPSPRLHHCFTIGSLMELLRFLVAQLVILSHSVDSSSWFLSARDARNLQKFFGFFFFFNCGSFSFLC